MKNILLFILAIFLNISVFAHKSGSFYGKIESQEHTTITNPFEINLKLWFLDTTNIENIKLNLPDGWSATISNSNVFKQYLPNDSIIISYNVSVPDTSNLPYYQNKKSCKSFKYIHYVQYMPCENKGSDN